MSRTPHGGLNACRCFTCRVIRAEWERKRLQAVRDGRPFTTTCELSAARLERFIDAGFTFKAIGRPLGIEGKDLKRIVDDPQGVMLRSTQDRIMGLRVSEVEPGRVSALGAMRRLRDLSLLGWQTWRVSAESGLSENTVRRVVLGHHEVINATTDATIRETFDRLSRLPPPDDYKARSWARKSLKRGWRRIAAFEDPDRETDSKRELA